MLETFKPLFARYTENTQKYTVRYTDRTIIYNHHLNTQTPPTLIYNHLLYTRYLTLIYYYLLYTQTKLEILAFTCL